MLKRKKNKNNYKKGKWNIVWFYNISNHTFILPRESLHSSCQTDWVPLSHDSNKVHSQAGSQLGTCLALCFVRMLIIFITLKTKTIRTQNQTKPHFCVSSSLNSSDLSNIQLWRRSGFSSFSRCFSFPLRSCKVSISDLDSFQTELVGVSKNFIW